jgi:hypothetical protein
MGREIEPAAEGAAEDVVDDEEEDEDEECVRLGAALMRTCRDAMRVRRAPYAVRLSSDVRPGLSSRRTPMRQTG